MAMNETDLKIDYSSYDDPIWRTTFNNADVPGLSPKVEFAHNAEFGYHLVASKNIEAGICMVN